MPTLNRHQGAGLCGLAAAHDCPPGRAILVGEPSDTLRRLYRDVFAGKPKHLAIRAIVRRDPQLMPTLHRLAADSLGQGRGNPRAKQ